MALVPFGSTKKPAGYHGASGPGSPGRMPTNVDTAALENDSAPNPSITTPAPPVDGSLRGHDTNYPDPPKETN
jgi:hypothetical protein